MAKEKQNIVMGPARWGGKYPNRKLHVEVVEDVKRKELNEKIKEIMSTKKNVSSEELSKLTGTKCTVVRPEDKK